MPTAPPSGAARLSPESTAARCRRWPCALSPNPRARHLARHPGPSQPDIPEQTHSASHRRSPRALCAVRALADRHRRQPPNQSAFNVLSVLHLGINNLPRHSQVAPGFTLPARVVGRRGRPRRVLADDYLWRRSAKIGAGKFRPLRPLPPP